jgi:biopolymer transport protein ExbD
MKLEPKAAEEDIEIDMSPMIDMVFLLLIFFIVASQVIDEKPDVNVPAATHATIAKDTTGRLMITVTKDERYFLASKQMRDLEELQSDLAVAFEADPNLRILIRSDGETKYKVNEKVITICGEVGATDLIYSAFEE